MWYWTQPVENIIFSLKAATLKHSSSLQADYLRFSEYFNICLITLTLETLKVTRLLEWMERKSDSFWDIFEDFFFLKYLNNVWV